MKRKARYRHWGLAAAFAASLGAGELRAAERAVPAGQDLQAAIDAAEAGDVLTLQPGVHRGPVRLRRAITLAGEAGTIVRGTGQGSVITVEAPKAVVRGLQVEGSGRDLEAMDSGIFVKQSATGARVEHNRLEGNLYGIYLHGAADAVAARNIIVGMTEGRLADAGNGVAVWNAPGAKVLGNDISFGRDGIFSISSKRNVFSGNRFRDLRFAIHYMYTNDSEISDNVSTGNAVGYALMFSNRLKVRGNVSEGDRDHGMLFNYANGSEITGNRVTGALQPAERWAQRGQRADAKDSHMPGVASDDAAASAGAQRLGPEKCVFIYNANQNTFRGNWFENCEIGVHFTAGSERNQISGNAFVNNRNQVKYVGTRDLDWSASGRGNYWSDNPGFDLDGDGLADTAYRPNDLIDRVLWTAPAAKVLVNAPAVQVIRWAQSQFPAILPGGVLDTKPLIAPPPKPRENGTQP